MKKPLIFAALLCGLMVTPAFARHGAPGYNFGPNLKLAPVVSVGAFWESNARDTRTNEKSGGGWTVRPTLSLTHRGRKTNLSASAFYTMERGFDSKDALDSDSYGLSMGVSRELSQHYTLTFSASYTRSEDDQFYSMWNNTLGRNTDHVDKDKQENYNVSTALGFQNQKWQWSISAGWARTKYLEGYKHETDTYSFSAMAGRAITAHSYWNLSFSTSWDDSSYSGAKDEQGYYIMTGVSGAVTNKTTYNAMAGVAIYDFKGQHGSQTEVGPSYNVGAAYKFNRTFAFSLAMSSRYEPEYGGDILNYCVWSHHLTGAVNAQWTDKLSSRLNLSWVYEDHMAEKNYKGGDFDRTYYQIAFNTHYNFTANAAVYGGVSWRTDDYSDESGSKDNLRFDLGLRYSF